MEPGFSGGGDMIYGFCHDCIAHALLVILPQDTMQETLHMAIRKYHQMSPPRLTRHEKKAKS
jgi:hypothetical protein